MRADGCTGRRTALGGQEREGGLRGRQGRPPADLVALAGGPWMKGEA